MSAPDQAAVADPGAPDGEGGLPGPDQDTSSSRRLQLTQAQVDDVLDIMRVNVDKVIDRDENLMELDNRADALHDGARTFESSAAKLKNKYWWKNCKMMIIMGVVVVLLVGTAFLYFYH